MRNTIRQMARVTTLALMAGTLTLAGSGVAAADPGIAAVGPSLRSPGTTLGTVEGIKCVQKAVGVVADGQYGPATFDAVQAFQEEKGIAVDGTVGPVTGDLILLAVGFENFYRCYEHVPTTYTLDPGDGAIAMGGDPVECLMKQGNSIRKDLIKIFGGKSNLSHVVRSTGGRGWSTAFGLVKCTFIG
jgi:peptidoglycan hydrolase-like protein with peptidoglycan-binding domain